MNRPNSEIKRIARENLTGSYSLPIAASLLVSLIPTLVMLPFSFLLTDTSSLFQNIIYYLAYFIILILTVVLQAGQCFLHLNLARKRPYSLKDLLYCFKNRPDVYILGFLLYLVYLLPYLLISIAALYVGMTFFDTAGLVLGIVIYLICLVLMLMRALYYAPVFLLLLDDSSQKLRPAFAECKRLMTGNRKRFFLLLLSFLGLYLLGILSLGIGLLWVSPYLLQSQVVFYLDLTGELDRESASQENTYQSSFAQP